MRAFVALRRYAFTHEDLRARLDALELKTARGFKKILDKLMEPDLTHKPTLGFARKKVG